MDLDSTSSATSQVRSAVREVMQSQGGSQPAGGSLAASKSTPGVPKEMTGREDPSPGSLGHDDCFCGRRDFGEKDNVSYIESDDFWG